MAYSTGQRCFIDTPLFMVAELTEPLHGTLRLVVTGGAAGVGKSTLLKSIPIKTQFNTGTLFKERMAIADRDAIRSNDWSLYEEQVADDLTAKVVENLECGESVVIDTHFAAKLNGKNYRIGLKQNLIFKLGAGIFQHVERTKQSLRVHVVLVTCKPASLLRRRRLDKSRQRDLVPSDCLNTLRTNRFNANQYLTEFLRARQGSEDGGMLRITFHMIENEDLDAAIKQFNCILKSD